MTDAAPTRRRIELVVFDFDGTLCDSADVKTDAFHDLYLNQHGPALAGKVKDYHLANVGISRYDKIRYVETEMLGNEPNDTDVEQIASRYSGLVEQAVVDAPLFDGVAEFLAMLHPGVTFAVASATPTDELRRIVERKRLTGCFAAIGGSPRPKAAILAECVERFAGGPGSAVIVGDQPSDGEAARIAGTGALLIAPPASWTKPFERVDDFPAAAALLRDWMSGGS